MPPTGSTCKREKEGRSGRAATKRLGRHGHENRELGPKKKTDHANEDLMATAGAPSGRGAPGLAGRAWGRAQEYIMPDSRPLFFVISSVIMPFQPSL
mmetsp:Transcript_15214/g.41585  ORF Transcript_15214/g.41585 Transcript_15214/m.41585 type:complete len:97 (-) Transcript_15214:838-1128(-)